MIRKQIARVLLFFVLLAAPSFAEQMVCQNDFDSDGDIDGNDLAAMISQSEAGLNEDATELFAGEFGHMNCTIPPLKIKLTADDFKKDDEFGYAVSISGDFAIIGARGDKDKSYAYIFKREGTGWIQQQKLTINAAGREGYYWVSVAIDGEYAIVGASGDNHYGAVQIFKREGTTWIRQDILGTFIRGSKDNFGCAVSIYGEYAVVGARGDSAGYYSGAVFIFKREGSAWIYQQKLKGNDTVAGDDFGRSVSINGDYFIVGAPLDDEGTNSAGSAYIFKRENAIWTQQKPRLSLIG